MVEDGGLKHKVSELEGADLDAAVALAEGYQLHYVKGGSCWAFDGRRFIGYIAGDNVPGWEPSRSWQHGGPIIERERINLSHIKCATEPKEWVAVKYKGMPWVDGPTALIAAMRAYVSSKFGPEVEL